jgi:hypothetical protein
MDVSEIDSGDGIKRIVFLDFIHHPVSQEQTKLKIIDKRLGFIFCL